MAYLYQRMDPLPEQERFEVSTLVDFLSHDPLFILFTGIFLDLMLFALLQINYRDFLQSPLQVITVSLILKF